MIQIILGLAFLLPIVLFGWNIKVILGMAVLFFLWRISLAIWPEKRCPSCSGNGSRGGPMRWMRGCGECQGSGRVPRIGAKE